MKTSLRTSTLSLFAHMLFCVGLLIAWQGTSFAQVPNDTTDASHQKADQPGMTAGQDTLGNNIVSTLKERGNFTTLVSALEQTGLASQLQGEGSFTLFAPTDAAFEKLSGGTLESLNERQLSRLLRYHLVSEELSSTDAAAEGTVVTSRGTDLTVRSQNGKTMVGKATVAEADIQAGNGVIHVIDTVLMPPKKNKKKMGSATPAPDANQPAPQEK